MAALCRILHASRHIVKTYENRRGDSNAMDLQMRIKKINWLKPCQWRNNPRHNKTKGMDMKSTIKLTPSKSVTVQPCKLGGVTIDLGPHTEILSLTPDQCGALIFALEAACEANEVAAIGSAETLNDKG